MSKHPRPPFDKWILYYWCNMSSREDVAELVSKSFDKKDLIEAVKFIYEKTNPIVNDKMEKFYYKKLKEKNGVVIHPETDEQN